MHDPKLPTLPRALDAAALPALFRRIPGLHLSVVASADSVRARLLKHKPGKHGVIHYTLSRNGGDGGETIHWIGKLYRDQRGAERFEKLQMLWAAAQQQPAAMRPGMPEPVAYLPELGMILMSCVPGRDLYALIGQNDVSGAIRQTAANLGKLHALKIPALTSPQLADHLVKLCRPGPQALAEAYPEFTGVIQDILTGLAKIDREDGPRCPVHGDLNFGQVLIDGSQVHFIDFDGICNAHPALDVGNFLAAVRVYFPARYPELETQFIETYLQYQPNAMLGGLPSYRALAFFRRAMICHRNRASGPAATTNEVTKIGTLLQMAATQLEIPEKA